MRVDRLLDFRFFIIGLTISFTLLLVAGRSVSSSFSYNAPFTRFNEYLLRDTNYFPTASSMLNTALIQSTPDQTLVLIGGNSILRGFGQGANDIWSEKLQQLLGSNYRVFNFAMPTGSLHMNAAVIAEALHKKGRKVIVVTNSLYSAPNLDFFGNWDCYILLEAYYKNLLDEDYRGNMKLKSSYLFFKEKQLGQFLNSYLYFNDLWSFITYRYVSTIWTSLTYWNWTGARMNFKDPDYEWAPRNEAMYEALVNVDIDNLMSRTIHGIESGQLNSNKYTTDIDSIGERISMMRDLVPEYLRKSTVIVLSAENPYIINKMSAIDRSMFEYYYSLLENGWSAAGYKTLRIGLEIPYGQWNDAVHLSAPGGEMLANALSPIIIDINRAQFSPR